MTVDSAKAPAKPRVLIVDDQPLMREGLAHLLGGLKEVQVCGAADSVASARDQMANFRPQLVIMELNLGSGDIIDFLKSFRDEFQQTRVLIYTSLDERLFVERALGAGASGYLMKQEPAERFVEAVRAVLGGDLYVSRRISALLLRRSVENHGVSRMAKDAAIDSLTDRELHVFRLLGSGLSTRSIAADLNLSIKTVEAHREHIKHKLGSVNGTGLIQMATDWVRDTFHSGRSVEF
jgi:DNA-binding NarL/FixJ family response regulator